MLYTAINPPLVIWMMRSFLQDLPYETIEAARIDEASLWQELMRVMPLGPEVEQEHSRHVVGSTLLRAAAGPSGNAHEPPSLASPLSYTDHITVFSRLSRNMMERIAFI